MQEAFGIVLFAVVAVAAVVAVVSLAGSPRLYEQIGRGGLSLDRDSPRRGPAPGSPAAAREREEEIRQLVGAANERRARRGETAVDVEAEVIRLSAPAVDPELAAEVRGLVLARNERRRRAGREPLDVDAEVARQLRALGS